MAYKPKNTSNKKHTEKKRPSVLTGTLVLALITCPLLAQAACWAEIPKSTPDTQLIDNLNSTVSDNSTGLMWKQCSEGQTNEDSIYKISYYNLGECK